MLSQLYLAVLLLQPANAQPRARDEAVALIARAEALARENKEPEARELAGRAEALGGEDPAVLQRLANFYIGVVPDPPKAASLGWRYAELAPGESTAWRRVAALYLALNNPERAVAAGLRGLPGDDTPD